MKHWIDRLHQALPLKATPEIVAGTLLEQLHGDAGDLALRQRLAERLRNDASELGPIVDELLRHPRATARHARRLLAQQLPRPAPGVTFVSLGTHCFTASLLRNWELRSWSGPFDWLFSSVDMVRHCIDDDFESFLDRSLYEPVPVEDRPHGPDVNRVHHRLFRERFGIDYVFNHHDPHEDDDHAHFQRSVERFRVAMRSAELTVFVVIRVEREGESGDLSELRDSLSRRCRNFRLCVYEVPPVPAGTFESPCFEVRRREPGFEVSRFMPTSQWHPTWFDELVDEHVLVSHLLSRSAAGSVLSSAP